MNYNQDYGLHLIGSGAGGASAAGFLLRRKVPTAYPGIDPMHINDRELTSNVCVIKGLWCLKSYVYLKYTLQVEGLLQWRHVVSGFDMKLI